jgi:transcriptional regulator with XRE-family HTH domain
MNDLAARLRTLRRQQQRTLKDVAERCGFTTSLLSKIESGKTAPPVATLTKIAAALGTTLGDLVAARHNRATAVTRAETLAALPPTRTDKGYGFHLLAAERSGKAMQPFLFVAERGRVSSGAMSHRGEEFVFVLEGRMNYRVGAASYTLGPGDSVYFSSVEEHDLEPLTDTVRYLAVFTDAVPDSSPTSLLPLQPQPATAAT